MAAAIKMDELLVSWLGSDAVYENVLELIENYRAAEANRHYDENAVEQLKAQQIHMAGSVGGESQSATTAATATTTQSSLTLTNTSTSTTNTAQDVDDQASQTSPRGVIPPFYPAAEAGKPRRRRRTPVRQHDTWEPLPVNTSTTTANSNSEPIVPVDNNNANSDKMEEDDDGERAALCVRDQVRAIYDELGQDPPLLSPSSDDGDNSSNSDNNANQNKFSSASSKDERHKYLSPDVFVRIAKDVCRFPSFFNYPLYQRILDLWNSQQPADQSPMEVVTLEMMEWYWMQEMEPYDMYDRFYRLVKQIGNNFIVRDDFLPFVKALLNDHPGLEFLSSHAEFQEKYAVTVITRIFYAVNKCHSGRITSRQIRRSDLLEAFQQVDEEEDINKVTRYFSYEHFYVLYCRFWELDHDRDYRITREDLLKYGDHSLSHMIVDRIFDAAPRPFEQEKPNREFLSYEDFIYFMLSEEDKANEVSVRYWFSCVDVDGDAKLNNMEMRSFYAVQLHRMQCMGHEIVPFEDMLCQMMDMIKPHNADFLVAEDFLQPECSQVSGALFDALFNLNKYLLFEQRDPFVERQKREDEFECDWDRFACIDYNRLAMEEEAREEEAMEIDWVTVDDEEEDDQEDFGGGGAMAGGGGSSEAPF
jgi:serine/threonine-protein phosphatase 2A regulatory subunit B''